MSNVRVYRAVLASAVVCLVVTTLPTGAAAQTGPYQFHSLTPCRVVDTRKPTPAPINSMETRLVAVQNVCNVPTGAAAVSLNVTVVGPNGPGYLTLFPTGITKPTVSTINFAANEPALANGAIAPLGTLPDDLSVFAYVSATSGGKVNVVIDVTGYFQ